MAERLEFPFLGEIPLVQSIREAGDNGTPIVMQDETTAAAFVHIAKELARSVALRNAHKPAAETV